MEVLDGPETPLKLQTGPQWRRRKAENSSQKQMIIRPWSSQEVSGPIPHIHGQFSKQQTHPRADTLHTPEPKLIEWHEPDKTTQMQLEPLGLQAQPKPDASSNQQNAAQAFPELPTGSVAEGASPALAEHSSNAAAIEALDCSLGVEGVQEAPAEVDHSLDMAEQVREKHSLAAEGVQIRNQVEAGRAVQRQRRNGMMLDFGLAPRKESPDGSPGPGNPPEAERHEPRSMHQSQKARASRGRQ